MKAANIDITLTGNMLLDIWKKFVLLSGTSGITRARVSPWLNSRRRRYACSVVEAHA